MAFGLKRNIAEQEGSELPQFEAPVQPEIVEQKQPDKYPDKEKQSEAAETSLKPTPSSVNQAKAPAPQTKTPQFQKIEHILEEDLKDYYSKMDDAHKNVFRIEGENTVRQIDTLITTAKATAKRILYLLQRWLRLIPRINSFFLEQEAKIKTDKIMEIMDEKKTDI